MSKKEADGRFVNRDVHNAQNTFEKKKRKAEELAQTSAEFGYVAGAIEAQEHGAPEAVVQQADRDTPRSVGGRIDDWFNRILSRLPQQQINTLREQVEKYLTRKDEKEELTDDDFIENAKCLIKGVMEKFSTDGDQSAVHNFTLMVFLHKLIAEELAKHVNFGKIGILYLEVFKDLLFTFLMDLTKEEFQKIWDVTLKAAEDLLTIKKTVAAAVLAISCMYLYNNYIKE